MHIDDIQDRELRPERRATERMRGFELDLLPRVHKPPEPRLVARGKTPRFPIHNADVILSTGQMQADHAGARDRPMAGHDRCRGWGARWRGRRQSNQS
jgi:hypothetical protein